jgi:hypothetical protein
MSLKTLHDGKKKLTTYFNALQKMLLGLPTLVCVKKKNYFVTLSKSKSQVLLPQNGNN